MAIKKRFAFIVDNNVLPIGKATGQAKARALLSETVEGLEAKGWSPVQVKADKAILNDPKGTERTITIKSV